ncbi:MAG: hypothetical protein JNL73_03335 [Anaerolineales bacterium]|nr:hypothetical protein [Anaerolineales bacterium]
MTISIGLFGGDETRRATIHAQVARPPALVVAHSSGQLVALQWEPTLPQVLLLGVPEIRRRRSDDPFYGLLARLQTDWPAVRIAVWADAIEAGAAFDLIRVGVLGIVLWSDARAELWPLLARSVYARTQTWSRPFDSRLARRDAPEAATVLVPF